MAWSHFFKGVMRMMTDHGTASTRKESKRKLSFLRSVSPDQNYTLRKSSKRDYLGSPIYEIRWNKKK